MNKVLLLAAAAVALSAGGLADATENHPTLVGRGKPHHFAHNPTDRSLTVLYDQNSNDSGLGVVSQNFESSFDTFDNQDADDFTVPDGTTWKVSEVDVTGLYFDGHGPADSENVFFYHSKNGFPKKLVAELDNLAGKDDGLGSFVIKLPKAVKLKSGTYEISVQANMNFNAGGEWGWENTSTQTGTPAKFQNPGDGLGTGCIKWKIESSCIMEGEGPDHMFTLKGKATN